MTDRASRLALTAIVAVLALAASIVVFSAILDTAPAVSVAGASSPSSAGEADAVPEGTGSAPHSAATDGPSAPSDRNGDAQPGGDDETGQANERTSSEVLPATEETSPLGLPVSPSLPGLVTAPLPATASATGSLVAGFPSAVIPLEEDSAVESSSVASAENRLQVTLVGTTPSSMADVLEFYRVSFAANHLVDSMAPAAHGSTALLFSRGTDTILLTVTPAESGDTAYSVFGAFTAA